MLNNILLIPVEIYVYLISDQNLAYIIIQHNQNKRWIIFLFSKTEKVQCKTLQNLWMLNKNKDNKYLTH